jgi:hypothetical protein
MHQDLFASSLQEGAIEKGRYFCLWIWEYFPERLQISAVLDRAILNDEGETRGEVDDLFTSPQGKLEQIIQSVGGFLDLEAKLVALPLKPLKITDMGIVYDVTKQKPKDQPEFS